MNSPHKKDIVELGMQALEMFMDKLSQSEEDRKTAQAINEINTRAFINPHGLGAEAQALLKNDAPSIFNRSIPAPECRPDHPLDKIFKDMAEGLFKFEPPLGLTPPNHGAHPSNLSEYLYHNYPTEQPPVMGLYQPAPLFHPNQDPNLPFLYNPVEDSYLGFRYDYAEEGPLIPPLTKEMIARYSGLYLTTHPRHYHSPWVKKAHRLTEVFFKRPKVLITTSDDQFHSWFRMTDPQDSTLPGILELHPSLKWYTDQGYNALMCIENKGCPPEILLINPADLVTGVRWTESQNGNNAFPLHKNYVIYQDHETRTIAF